MSKENLPQWSRFWEQGFITTFGPSKPNNYEGVVRAFWRDKFVELPNGARILDIAAGNGAIATLAAEVSRDYDKGFFIAATDLAEICAALPGNGEASLVRETIEFHSNTPCHKQPFDDDFFDFACSQFGFEYSDTGAAIAEMRRVLAPGGQFVAISHHADSALIKAARIELEIYRYALDELDLVGRIGKLFDALGNPGESQLDAALRRTRPYSEAVNKGMDDFRQRYPDHDCAREIVGAIGELARGAKAVTREHRLAAVGAATEDFLLAQARLQDMVNAALDQEQVDALRNTAAETGFAAAYCLDLYSEDGALAGWQIHMR